MNLGFLFLFFKALYINNLNYKTMNKDKLVSIGISSMIGGLFGGLICCIKDALFEKDVEKSTSLKEAGKSFGGGFLIGSALSGLQETLFYDGREKFKERVIEEEVRRRTTTNK